MLRSQNYIYLLFHTIVYHCRLCLKVLSLLLLFELQSFNISPLKRGVQIEKSQNWEFDRPTTGLTSKYTVEHMWGPSLSVRQQADMKEQIKKPPIEKSSWVNLQYDVENTKADSVHILHSQMRHSSMWPAKESTANSTKFGAHFDKSNWKTVLCDHGKVIKKEWPMHLVQSAAWAVGRWSDSDNTTLDFGPVWSRF